jgi:hypothetical protein
MESFSMNSPVPRLGMHGRPCRIELVDCRAGWWYAHVYAGEVILRQTRIHSSPEQARAKGQEWLTKYLETGSWTEATDWHEKNYWGAGS